MKVIRYRVGQDDDRFMRKGLSKPRVFKKFGLVTSPNCLLVFLNGVLLTKNGDYTEKTITPKGTKVIEFKTKLRRGDMITEVWDE
jgi:hypothetical protein